MAQEFTKVAQAHEIPEGGMKVVEVEGERIVLANVDGQYYAFGDECPHAGASLSGGYLEGETIECPLHGAAFDIKTGSVEQPPADEGVPSYAVKVEGTDILISLS